MVSDSNVRLPSRSQLPSSVKWEKPVRSFALTRTGEVYPRVLTASSTPSLVPPSLHISSYMAILERKFSGCSPSYRVSLLSAPCTGSISWLHVATIPSSLARSMSSFASSNLLPNTRQRMYHLFSAFFSFFRGVVSRYHMYSIKFSIMAASLLPPCTLYYVPDSHIDVSCHDDLVLFKNHVIRRLQDVCLPVVINLCTKHLDDAVPV